MPLPSLDDLAQQLGVTAKQVRGLIESAGAGLPQRRYYVFRAGGDSSGGSGVASGRPRTIAAFPTPDDALAFVQRNGHTSLARLKSMPAADLLLLLLHDPQIARILFLQAMSGDERAGGFPPGTTISRQALLDRLRPDARRIELTAKAFDTLQFGVDFARRGAFRAALTEAVEAVVAGYVPPPGSLDRGPRSVYATGAVEQWLRDNGFPHAAQRRWIQVADQPGWLGAEELCEIDCGTQHHLVVQLLIYNAQDRQYIGRVAVTS